MVSHKKISAFLYIITELTKFEAEFSTFQMQIVRDYPVSRDSPVSRDYPVSRYYSVSQNKFVNQMITSFSVCFRSL